MHGLRDEKQFTCNVMRLWWSDAFGMVLSTEGKMESESVAEPDKKVWKRNRKSWYELVHGPIYVFMQGLWGRPKHGIETKKVLSYNPEQILLAFST